MFLYGTHTNAYICLLSTRGFVFLRLWTFVVLFLRTIPLCFFLLGCRVRLLVASIVNMRSLSIAVILMRAGILQKSVGVFLQNQNVLI